ncbi:nuclease-related domain-containing protein [Bacillus fonticola]|uniref:nuclease-related domain-containing protein n=1 Tax=Bacillus fonticola TaxID=2728853 RepID=UPI001476287C|nr:nuclease-related domain-containing protein [Bacillus fonticola]
MNHKKRELIRADNAKDIAGYRGERTLDYYLKPLSNQNFTIFPNLRLILNEQAFQIDTLILTRSFFLLIEAKDITGTLTFDSIFDQFTRTDRDVETRYKHPITQVKRQGALLKSWFQRYGTPPLPFNYLAAFTNPTTILKTNSIDHPENKNILLVENVSHRILELKKANKLDIMSTSEHRKLTSKLLQSHTNAAPNMLQEYNISPQELITGVQCEKCSSFTMKEMERSWECSVCHHRSLTAHKPALLDYFLLISPTITNAECREFLKITSRHKAKRYIQSMEVTASGSKKGQRYHWRGYKQVKSGLPLLSRD